MGKINGDWQAISVLRSRPYNCGHCGCSLSSERGYLARFPGGAITGDIYICHLCNRPTFFDREGNQFPGAIFGDGVNDIPNKEVETLYNEARRCLGVCAYTASILCSRKLLMNISVSKGASEGLNFIGYVEFLADKNFIPPDGKEWVDHIRTIGNEATHEIKIMKREDAEDLIRFNEMLLKFIFEFPATVKKRKQQNTK